MLPFATPDDGAKKKEGPKIQRSQLEPPGDLSGYYTCKGKEAGGKNYSGIVVMTKKNEVYVVQWVMSGGSNFSGVGIRQGNTFAASWAMPSPTGQIIKGVNLYTVTMTPSGPCLTGRWASIPGPGLQQEETFMFLKSPDPEPD